MHLRRAHLFFALLLPFTLFADDTSKSASPAVDMQWSVKIPLRDGVILSATCLFSPDLPPRSAGWIIRHSVPVRGLLRLA